MKRILVLGLVCAFGGFRLQVVCAQQDCPRWEQVQGDGNIRYGHVMAYDRARSVFVITGGAAIANGPYSTEWTMEWNGADFLVRDYYLPFATEDCAITYDAAHGITLLVGTHLPFSILLDPRTWIWNGISWTPHDSPGFSVHGAPAMAFDGRRNVVVLFGGYANPPDIYSGSPVLNDTWEWNGTSWHLVAQNGPSPRYASAMAYDSARGVTVLFGGVYADAGTWEWDGITWTLRAMTGPAPRHAHAMVFDERAKVTVLFGGYLGNLGSSPLGDTWVWNGEEWSQLNIAGPSPRAYHQMAFDNDRGITVLDGGYPATGMNNYNGPDWALTLCPPDTDGDGVPDDEDACPDSDLSANLSIGGCDTGLSSKMVANGCTMADEVKQCADRAANHGDFVSCVSAASGHWLADNLIAQSAKGAVMRCAAHAVIPSEIQEKAKGSGRHVR